MKTLTTMLLVLVIASSLTWAQSLRNTRTDTMSPSASGGTDIIVNANLDVQGDASISGGLSLTGLTSGSIMFMGGSSELTEDNLNLFFDDVNNRLSLGTLSPQSRFSISGSDQPTAKVDVNMYNDVAGDFPSIFLRRARNNEAVPAEVQAGDTIGELQIQAHNDAAFIDGVSVRGVSTQTWASAITGGAKMELSVNPDGAFVQEVALTLEENKDATFVGAIAAPQIDISSTSEASKPCPSMTEVQRDAIISLSAGKCVFNTTTSASNVYNGAAWEELGTTGPVVATHPLWTVSTAYVTGEMVVDGANFKLYRANNAYISGAVIQADIAAGDLDAIGGSGNAFFEVNQAAHGRAVGFPLTPVYFSGGVWTDAQSDAQGTLATHVIVEVADVDNFTVATSGRYEAIGHGLTIETHYFVSDTLAGSLTATEPNLYSNPMIFVETANIIHVMPFRAFEFKGAPSAGGGGGAVDSVFGRIGVVVAASGDYTASEVTNVPAGTIASTTVQAAIDELDTDIQALIGPPTFYLKDYKPNGAHGGGSTASGWYSRDVNTLEGASAGIATVLANQFTLVAGTYSVTAGSPYMRSAYVRTRIQNITDASTPAGCISDSAWMQNITQFITSRIKCEIVIGATKTFEIQYYVFTSFASTGLGQATYVGTLDELYSQMKIVKLD